MGYIERFLNTELEAKKADELVNQTLRYLYERSKYLSECFPVLEIDTWDYKGLLFKEEAPIANLVADGQEIPVRSFGKFEDVLAEVVKIADSYMYDEVTMKRMYLAMRDANLQGTSVSNYYDENGKLSKQGTNNDLANLIFGSITTLTRGIMDRLDTMTWQVIQTAQLDIKSINTNIGIDALTYREQAADYNHFPTPLSTTGDPEKTLNRWSDYENANGIANLYNAIDTFIDTNGFQPKYIGMSRKLMNHLRQQKSTQQAATASLGTLGIVSPDRLKDVIKANNIEPELVVIDDMYQEKDIAGKTTRKRMLNEDTFVFLNPGMGKRIVAPSIDSVQDTIAEGNDMPKPKKGLYIKTYEKSVQPKVDVTFGSLNALPVVLDPRMLYAWRVN